MPETIGSRMSVVETKVDSHGERILGIEVSMQKLVSTTAQLAVLVKLLTWMFGLSFPVVITGLIYVGVSAMRG